MATTTPRTVCLLAAGLGTRMGIYADMINKTLLPVHEKAIISHIIDQFPDDTNFVVAVGYKHEQVMSYLKIAHPTRIFTFVHVGDFSGPGSGPAVSVSKCKHLLHGPFMIIACDALYTGLAQIPTDENVVAVSAIPIERSPDYCNIVTEGDRVTDIIDKRYCESGIAANGVYNIFDVEKFFANLSGTELSSGYQNLVTYVQLIPFVDLGTFEKYQTYYDNSMNSTVSYDYSKTDEFLYFVNNRVVKFFKDIEITDDRVIRARYKPLHFPKIDVSGQFYGYDYETGHTLYENNPIQLFETFVHWLDTDFWPPIQPSMHPDAAAEYPLTKKMCLSFYYDKTMRRLEKFRQKYPDFNPQMINNVRVTMNMETVLNQINWDDLCGKSLDERSAFIHGDLQFDNIIYNPGEDRFVMLDWRQDFAGRLAVGDKYYDIAKLIGGMIVNYDLIKKNQFWYKEPRPGHVQIEFTRRSTYDEMIALLRTKFNDPIIDDIVSLIYLNMSPLHGAPYDKLLFSLALQRLNLKYANK